MVIAIEIYAKYRGSTEKALSLKKSRQALGRSALINER